MYSKLFLCFSADTGNFTATRACLRPRSELGFHTEEFKPVEAPDNKSVEAPDNMSVEAPDKSLSLAPPYTAPC